MRIGINALYLLPGQVGGTEIYLRSLLGALAGIDGDDEYLIFTNRETGSDLVPPRSNFEQVPQRVGGTVRAGRIAWEQAVLPVEAARRRLDVLFNPGFTAPLLCPCPMVTVFHDLQHKSHPEHFRWWDLPFWRLMLFQSACTSEWLIAVSEATRSDLLRYYPVAPGRVRAIPHGVDERFFEIDRRRGGSGPFLLCVSTLHPHKNLDRLVRAFARFRAARPGIGLVIAGMRGFHAEALERLIAGLDLGDAVRLTGWIPREELYALFRDAAAFLYPSTFEGFGLPVLEALAAGLPTACSDIEPLAGNAGDAALLFPPEDESAIEAAMMRLTSDAALRDRLAAAGPLRARRFSWRTAAEATLAALKQATQM